MKPENQIAAEAARDWLLRLRQWQGFDLTEYQQASLIESFQSAIEKALDKSIHPHFTSESRAAHSSECKPIPGYKGCETHHIFGTDCPHASEPIKWPSEDYTKGYAKGAQDQHREDVAAHASDERYEMALRDSQRRGELLDKARASEQGVGQTLWQGNRVHELKCWPEFFEEIRLGNKTFELRKDDRNYQQFDRLLLREWKPDTEQFTGRTIQCIVTYLLKGKFGLGDGYVCMSILSQRPTPATASDYSDRPPHEWGTNRKPKPAHASDQLYRMEVIEKPWGREKVFTPAHASEQGEDTERLNWLHYKAMGSSIHMTLDQLLGTDKWTDLRSAIDKARNS